MSQPLFQHLPPLAPSERAALKESIRVHGVKVPILVDEDGTVIDGHHRQEFADQLGVDCPELVAAGLDDTQKRTLALELNLNRRQLNREQMRAVITESLQLDPQLSDREHARRTGATHPTVAAVRASLEDAELLQRSVIRIGGDGSVHPATKPDAQSPDADSGPGVEINYDETEAGGHVPETQVRRRQKRRPLPDQLNDMACELRKVTDRLERFHNDDRFMRNREAVASQLRHHLARAIGVLQGIESSMNTPRKG